MKKVYVFTTLLLLVSIAGCALKGPKVPSHLPTSQTQGTGNEQEFLGTGGSGAQQSSGISSVMEEYSGTIEDQPSDEILTSSGTTSSTISSQTETSSSKQEKELTEEDIDLMENIILQVKNLGK